MTWAGGGGRRAEGREIILTRWPCIRSRSLHYAKHSVRCIHKMIGNYTLSLIIFMADGIYNLLPHFKMGGMFGRGGMLGERRREGGR